MPCLKKSNRIRYRTVAFRMSDEEKALLEARVAAAGCQKQDYLIKAVLGQPVRIIGNEALFFRLREVLAAILRELERLDSPAQVGDDNTRNLRVAVELMQSVELLGLPGTPAGSPPKDSAPLHAELIPYACVNWR